MAEKSAKNQRGRPFQKGQSGNPGGKPPGTRARATVIGEKIMQDNADDIVKAAKNGDSCAMRLCVERLIPVRRGRPVMFDQPPIATAADVTSVLGTVVEAMAQGELTPDEAGAVAGVIEAKRRAIETVEFELRLQKLEDGALRR
jgi:hypothetical protein